MSFLHLSLLAGLGAVSIPIMLHLFGRSQPKIVDFPALRFVKETTQDQSMSWQLRHMLLLLLRVLLLAVLALALARPRVHSVMLSSVLTGSAIGMCAVLASLVAAVGFVSHRPRRVWLTAAIIAAALWIGTSLWGVQSLTSGPSVPSADQTAPVAAVLIVDNSPSMLYRAENKTRLEAAQEMGLWILDQLPSDSRVAILTDAPVGTLALDPATAKSQIKIIETRGSHVDLVSRLRTALDLVLSSELERKEVYIISDLMATSWSSQSGDVTELLQTHATEVLLQIIDVGQPDQANYRLGDAVPDFDTVPVDGEVTIEVEVHRPAASNAGENAVVSVELWQEQLDPSFPVIQDGKLVVAPRKVVDRQVAEFASGTTAKVTLRASDLAAGSHNFTITLDQTDPLAIDNQRYLTVVARPQQPTLIVAEDAQLGQNLQAIVDPGALSVSNTDESFVDHVRYVQLGNVPLEKYAVVCLYDPPPLTAQMVQKLEELVRGGGGLFIILGPALGTLETVQGNPLLKLLPGELSQAVQRTPQQPTVFPEPVALSHPVFAALGQPPDEVLWNVFPIYKNWTFSNLSADSLTLMRLSDGSAPMLLSQSRERGEILTLTTPIPEFDTRQRELWNLLWGSDPLPAFAILLGSFRTLSGAKQEQLNYQAGQTVTLPNDPLIWPSQYNLITPDAQTPPVSPPVDGALTLQGLDRGGTYYLRGFRDAAVLRSFSLNVPSQDTWLQRLEREQLDELLGADNYRLARDRSQVESSVGQARFGRELYPMLMLLIAGLFLAEQAMSNRFYQIKFGR